MAQSFDQFSEAYTKLLVASWSDESFAARLQENPRAAADEVGLEVGENVDLAISRPTEASSQTLNDYYEHFQKGIEAGKVDIVVPDAPMVDMQNLSEGELADVAGGTACCCCPCCCCN